MAFFSNNKNNNINISLIKIIVLSSIASVFMGIKIDY